MPASERRARAGAVRRPRRRLAGSVLAALLAAPAAGAGAPQDGPGDPDLGRRVYNANCYFCHGYSGDAKTLAARVLEPPPRDFTATPVDALTRAELIQAVRSGRPGTAMQGFEQRLSARQIEAVVDFVRQDLMGAGAPKLRYHSPPNGWTESASASPATPFVTGELTLDTPWERLDETQRDGRRLYLTACVSCHDRTWEYSEAPVWQPQAFSYPRGAYSHATDVDGLSGATRFAVHDVAPVIPDLAPEERRGEALYQANCAFCHAADGTARNWIGSFLEPRPRDFTDRRATRGMTPAHLAETIRRGLPGTSMPAWGAVLDDAEIRAVVAYIRRAFMDAAPTRAGLSAPPQ